MSVAPGPLIHSCPACGWSKTVHPRGDALLADQAPPERCPACGHVPIETRRAEAGASLLSSLGEVLERLKR